MKTATELIGKPAMLEQCAEECMELAHACLKMSRILRGENPTPKTIDEVYKNLAEESADVLVCISELIDSKTVDNEDILFVTNFKRDRMLKRINEMN